MPKSEPRLATDFFVAYFSSHADTQALLRTHEAEADISFLEQEDPDVVVRRIFDEYKKEPDFEKRIRKIGIVPKLIDAIAQLGGAEKDVIIFIAKSQIRAMYRLRLLEIHSAVEPQFAEDGYAALMAQALFLSRMNERFREDARNLVTEIYSKTVGKALSDEDLQMIFRARAVGIFSSGTLRDRFRDILDAVLPQRLPFMEVHELYIEGMSRTTLRMAKGLLP